MENLLEVKNKNKSDTNTDEKLVKVFQAEYDHAIKELELDQLNEKNLHNC